MKKFFNIQRVKAFGRVLVVLLIVLLGNSMLSSTASSAGSAIVDLGTANQYVLMGRYIQLHNAYVFGNAAIGNNAACPGKSSYNFDLESPGILHGISYEQTNAIVEGELGNILEGRVTANSQVTQAFTDATNAYNTAIGLAPDLTINGNVTRRTVTATHGGQYVIRITGDITGPLILNPAPGTVTKFVVIVEGTIDLGGRDTIGWADASGASNVLIIIQGTGTDPFWHVDNKMYGTVLAPYRGATFHGFAGAFIGGCEFIKLMSDAQAEFEPYQVNDWGDAPDSYGTLYSSNGPRHVLIPGLTLGTKIDADNDGMPGINANGDDTSGAIPDDEEAVGTLSFTVGTSPTVSVSVTNSYQTGNPLVGQNAYLKCWMDLNGDGDFLDTGEVSSQVTIPASSSTASYSVSFGALTTLTNTYLRCRLSQTASEIATPTGAATSGEVEDHLVTINALDYGDAPDTGAGTAQGNYNTTATDNGPSHVITSNLKLGTETTDADNGTLQNTAATADDTTGTTPDDEDGITTLPTITSSSSSVSLTVSVFNSTGSNATLACWIDFNRDGDFLDAGENQTTTVPTGSNNTPFVLTFSGFAAPTAGQSYIRCRIASNASEVTNPTGAANSGEIEDHAVTIAARDFGDAPDTGAGTSQGNYNTTASDNGPSHVISSNLKLGTATTDADNGTLQNVAANADDTTGTTTDDEDGVPTLPIVAPSSTSVTLKVSVFNNTNNPATLACWIDFNRNGSFLDTGERASATVNSSVNQQTITLTFSGFAAPAAGDTYLRCRIASTASEVTNPTGAASTGEVEDHKITASPTSAVLLSFTAQVNKDRVKLKWATGNEMELIGFNIWRAEAKTDNFAKLNSELLAAKSTGNPSGNDYAYVDTTAEPGIKYAYKLELVLTSESQWSDLVTAKIPAPACGDQVDAPTLLDPVNKAKLDPGKIEFHWNAVTCATQYKIELRLGATDGQGIVNKELDKTSFSIKRLEQGKTYYWRVLACNAQGKCAASEWWSLKIKK